MIEAVSARMVAKGYVLARRFVRLSPMDSKGAKHFPLGRQQGKTPASTEIEVFNYPQPIFQSGSYRTSVVKIVFPRYIARPHANEFGPIGKSSHFFTYWGPKPTT